MERLAISLPVFVVLGAIINDKLRDCSGRSGKRAYKVEGSVRLLLPLHEVARKGLFRLFWSYFFFIHFTIPVSIQQTEGTVFDRGHRLGPKALLRKIELGEFSKSLFRDQGHIIWVCTNFREAASKSLECVWSTVLYYTVYIYRLAYGFLLGFEQISIS